MKVSKIINSIKTNIIIYKIKKMVFLINKVQVSQLKIIKLLWLIQKKKKLNKFKMNNKKQKRTKLIKMK